MEHKVRQTFSLDPDIIERIDEVRGRHTKSAYVNGALDKILIQDEKSQEK